MNVERCLMSTAPPVPAARGSVRDILDANILAVLKAAMRIEPDIVAILSWYRSTPIAALDEMTAESLVRSGRLGDVLAFLGDIEDECRG